MDPALQELLASGEASDEVAIVLRLRESTAQPPPGVRIVARFGPIATARVERAAVWQIYGHPSVASVKAPQWLASEAEYGPLIDPIDAENVDIGDGDTRRPPDLAETGRGTVIGVVDWGCDFAHPDFIDAAGRSRLLALWDQRSQAIDANPYGYGRVLDRERLTAAIHADDPYHAADYHPARSDTGVGAHGTHVLGIAAGNGRGGGPVGLAPEAELLFVHLGAPGWEKAGPLGDSGNLLEAIHFIVSQAGDRPLVLNMSIGRHAGPHDGSTLVERAIDWLVRERPGTAVVQSTGNYYARNVHSAGQLRNGESVELAFQVRPGDTSPNELEVWYPGHDVFRAALIAPDGRRIAEVAQTGKAPVRVDGHRVGTLYHRARDPNNGDHHVYLFQYPNAPPGTWRLRLTGVDVSDGRYHAWLERDPGCRDCQALFAPALADPTSTTGSICNGLQTIVVGAYDAHRPRRPLAPFSSSGPTRDGRVRPVLLAPGVRVLAARSHPRQGTAPLLTRMSGTSMAAPHVAGTIALMLEAGGALDIVRIRQALFETLQPRVDDDLDDASRSGFGMLDTAAAVRRAAELGAGQGDSEAMSAQTPAALPLQWYHPMPAAPPAAIPGPEGLADEAGITPHAADAPSGASEEIAMHTECCGDACRDCEHCKDHACETCACCHDVAEAVADTGAEAWAGDTAQIQVVPSPFPGYEAEVVEAPEESVVQIVPSPLDTGDAVSTWPDTDDRAEEPQVQVVPSPLRGPGEAWAGEAEDAEDVEILAIESQPHPVDAAEALVEAGVDDSTEFIERSLRAAGRSWPAGCTVRTLFDDLCARTTPGRRLRMDRHFEVVGRPGWPLATTLQAGDIVIRRGDGGFACAAFVSHPLLYSEHEARQHGLQPESPRPGLYAHVIEAGVRPHCNHARFARRVATPEGIVLPDTLVARARIESAQDGREGNAEAWHTLEAIESNPDPNVRWLQTALNRAIGASLVVDGLIGPATRDAVRRYQSARGLQVDGIVGPQTLQALRADYPPPGYAPPPPSYPLPPAYGPPSPPPYTSPPPPPYEPPSTYTLPPTPPYEPPPPTYQAPPPAYPPPPPPPPYEPPPPQYERPPPPAYPPRPRPGYRPPTTQRPPAYPPARPPLRPPYRPRPPVYPLPPPAYPQPPAYPSDNGDGDGSCRTLDRFGYDSATLPQQHRAAIAELARGIVASGATAVSVTGYASPEGTASYNLELGRRRADAVAVALRQAIDSVRAGASARIRFDLRSEGEARQVSTDGPGNRRVSVCYEGTRPPPPTPPRPTPPRPQPRPPVPPPRPQLLVRHDAATPQGQAMLQRYEEAVRRMMALPARNPSSWTFQWYTHAVRSDRNKAGELNNVFGTGASPERALADRMWNTCRAHFDPSDSAFFLPWHRMYVYYFERICRQVLGDDTFTLPYWNYSSGSSVLPARFRDPRSPLFRADRNPNPNQGRPIDQGQPAGTISAERAFRLREFYTRGVRVGFSESLEQVPHDVVHGLIGNSRGMGSIAWAAGDPIFWLHHCNIDRLWASWNAAGRRNPTDAAWLGQRFTFADENGRRVDPSNAEHTTTEARGYRYDRLESMPSGSSEAVEADEPRRARRSVMAIRRTAAPSGGIPLGGNAIKVQLGRPVRDSGEADEAGTAPRKVYLVLRNYRANVQPNVIYHVYLALPAGARGQAAERHYVGPLSFFGAVPLPAHGTSFVGKTTRFDVTDIAGRLRAAGMLDDAPSVTIAPAGQPAASAQPLIGEITLVEE